MRRVRGVPRQHPEAPDIMRIRTSIARSAVTALTAITALTVLAQPFETLEAQQRRPTPPPPQPAPRTVQRTVYYQSTRSATRGFTVGGGLLGTSVSTDFGGKDEMDQGGGFNVEVGWGFTPKLTVFLGLSGSEVDPDGNLSDDYRLGQADLGIRYLFRGTDKQVRPYLEGALSAREIRSDDGDGPNSVTLKSRGGGLTGGGGVQIFFSPRVALDIGLDATGGSFSEFKRNGVDIPFPDVDATSTNLRLGVRFWPGSR